eukprot:11166989-Lingulodinium_polyedra.AAC.1
MPCEKSLAAAAPGSRPTRNSARPRAGVGETSTPPPRPGLDAAPAAANRVDAEAYQNVHGRA